MSGARLVVVVPGELAGGFRLAGVDTAVAADDGAAAIEVRRLIDAGEQGVVAVYEPFLEGFDPEWRSRLELSVAPVVLSLPSGLEEEPGLSLRARLSARLQRAVGYHVTFGEPS